MNGQGEKPRTSGRGVVTKSSGPITPPHVRGPIFLDGQDT